MVGGSELAMMPESSIDTPAAAGALIRRQRMSQGLTQQPLASAAGVSQKFLIDLESGHERAELGKTMAVLKALGLSLAAATPIPHGSDHDAELRDYAAAFTDLLARKGFEFAIKMIADYASTSMKARRPLLQRSRQLKDHQWPAALAGITNYTAHRRNRPASKWTKRIQPLSEEWMPAESYRGVR
jgi:y4mF family transcriptional regulator